MTKLLLCLILACLQAFSLANVSTQSHSDPDHTDWSTVMVTVVNVEELNDDLRSFFSNRILYNYTHSNIIYKKGLQAHRVQDIYFTVTGHQLFNISITEVADFVEYYYKVQLEDNYSKKVYEQIMTFQFVTGPSAFDAANDRVDDVTNTPDPVSPPINQWDLRFTNTTEVTFDLLTVLWNRTLIDGARAVGHNNFTDAINTKIGPGNYTSIDGPLEYVDVDNSDFKFYWNGYIWKDEAKTYYRSYEVDFQLTVEDGSTDILDLHIDDNWLPIC